MAEVHNNNQILFIDEAPVIRVQVCGICGWEFIPTRTIIDTVGNILGYILPRECPYCRSKKWNDPPAKIQKADILRHKALEQTVMICTRCGRPFFSTRVSRIPKNGKKILSFRIPNNCPNHKCNSPYWRTKKTKFFYRKARQYWPRNVLAEAKQ